MTPEEKQGNDQKLGLVPVQFCQVKTIQHPNVLQLPDFNTIIIG